ncbi:unnamed protein product [Cylicocyclus nassatus]|uniref:F-box domain-containing protein n=1 Tax=Cylicocyclus nassatus TaxID=53992 RepID=A0AA36GN13_CYLNA|nr:unnamed protein product [Cylicocyclus nassatus]
MPMRLRSGKTLGSAAPAEMTTAKLHESVRCAFPFLKLPPELCVRILKYLLEDPRELRYYGDARRICRSIRDMVDKNGSIIGMRAKRLIIGQHTSFDRFSRRFVVPKLVTFNWVTLNRIVRSLRENHGQHFAMIFFGVNFIGQANLMIELLKLARTVYLVMIDCRIPGDFVISLRNMFGRRHLLEWLRYYFVGSADSFEVYFRMLILEIELEWIHSLVSETLGPARVTSSGDGFLFCEHYFVRRNADYVRDITVICTIPNDYSPYYKMEFQLSGGSFDCAGTVVDFLRVRW